MTRRWSCNARPWPLCLAVVQCLALWSIPRYARAAAKSATMAPRAVLLCYSFRSPRYSSGHSISFNDTNSLWSMIATCVASLSILWSSSWCEVFHEVTPRIHMVRRCLYPWPIQVQTFRLMLTLLLRWLGIITWRLWMWRALCMRSVSSLRHCLSGCPCRQSCERGYTRRRRSNPKDSLNWPMQFCWSDYALPWMNMIRSCLSPWPTLAAGSLAPFGGLLSLMPRPVDVTSPQRNSAPFYFGNYQHSEWDDQEENYWEDSEWREFWADVQFYWFLYIYVFSALNLIGSILICFFCMFLLSALVGYKSHQCPWWRVLVVCFWAPASFCLFCGFCGALFSAWVDTHIWPGDVHFYPTQGLRFCVFATSYFVQFVQR